MCIYIICFPWTLWNKIVHLLHLFKLVGVFASISVVDTLWFLSTFSAKVTIPHGSFLSFNVRVPTGGTLFFFGEWFFKRSMFTSRNMACWKIHYLQMLFPSYKPPFSSGISQPWLMTPEATCPVFSQPVIRGDIVTTQAVLESQQQQYNHGAECSHAGFFGLLCRIVAIFWVGKWGVNNCGIESGSLLSDKKLSWVPAIDFQKKWVELV